MIDNIPIHFDRIIVTLAQLFKRGNNFILDPCFKNCNPGNSQKEPLMIPLDT